MSTVTTLVPVATRPALLKTEMSEEEYLALGATKHHEYYDGICVVNPPTVRHQRAERTLLLLLDPVAPDGFEVLTEAGWRTGGSWFEPDLMLVPVGGPDDIVRDAPLLIVEILSPSNRLDDIVTKRARYAEGGLLWYWIVDLDAPRLTVLQLVDGIFIERQELTGAGPTVGPVQANIDPSTLA